MSKRFTSTIAGASILITIVGLFAKGLGFFREVVFASYFGLGTEYEIYLVGAVLPITINVMLRFIGQNYFIPAYNNFKENKTAEPDEFILDSFWFFILFGLLLFLLLFLFSNTIVSLYIGDVSQGEFAIARNIFLISIVSVPFYSGISILSSSLQAEFEFRIPAISMLFLNLSIIILTVLFADTLRVYAIAYGFLLGIILQFLFLFNKVFKKINLFKFKKIKFTNLTAFVQSTFFLIVLIESMGQMNLLADRFFYNEVNRGGIAAINYSFTLFQLPITIFSMALSTAIFPGLSRSFSLRSLDEVETKIQNFFKVNSFIFLPISLVLIFYGDFIIQILFERGKFSSVDSAITFDVLRIHAFSLIFFSSYSVLNKLLYSANLTRYLFYLVIAAAAIKIILNFVLVESYQQNGLALSTTLTFIFFFISSYVIIIAKLKLLKNTIFIYDLLITVLNGAISYFIVYLIYQYLIGELNIALKILEIISFFLIYVLNAYLLKMKSINLFFAAYKNFRNKV